MYDYFFAEESILRNAWWVKDKRTPEHLVACFYTEQAKSQAMEYADYLNGNLSFVRMVWTAPISKAIATQDHVSSTPKEETWRDRKPLL